MTKLLVDGNQKKVGKYKKYSLQKIIELKKTKKCLGFVMFEENDVRQQKKDN